MQNGEEGRPKAVNSYQKRVITLSIKQLHIRFSPYLSPPLPSKLPCYALLTLWTRSTRSRSCCPLSSVAGWRAWSGFSSLRPRPRSFPLEAREKQKEINERFKKRREWKDDLGVFLLLDERERDLKIDR